MSIASVQSSNWVSQVGGVSSSAVRRGNEGDSDEGGQRVGRQKGGFAAAIASALGQIGVSGATAGSGNTASSTGDTSSQDPAQALSAFMQSLMSALHAQNSQANAAQGVAGADADGDGDSSTSSVQGHRHQRPNMQADLQSLIQQLASSGTANASSGSGSAVDGLQQSFQNLMSAVGDTNSNATLSNFLQVLSSQMSGASKVGNAISTTA